VGKTYRVTAGGVWAYGLAVAAAAFAQTILYVSLLTAATQ
jgi:hypothetical protein